MVTVGVNHCRLWTFVGKRLDAVVLDFGTLGRDQTFCCAAFVFMQYKTFCCATFVFMQYKGFGGDHVQLSGGFAGGVVTIAGTADGFVYILEGRVLTKVLSFAHTGPVLALATAGSNSVVSVGQDGKVISPS
ncbi:hypothetical protein T484DRAFT_1811435 [Baffinella frigidus]|nr:hypothetical protein T484DRAFT_1811435 [Cryptophyta sp. CCMP2293]